MSDSTLVRYQARFRDMKLDPEKWQRYLECEMTVELHQSAFGRHLYSIWGTNPPYLISDRLRTLPVAKQACAELFREQLTEWQEVR